jgi:hypothetical protein
MSTFRDLVLIPQTTLEKLVLVAEQQNKNRISFVGKDNRISAEISDRLLDLPNLLLNEYWGYFAVYNVAEA